MPVAVSAAALAAELLTPWLSRYAEISLVLAPSEAMALAALAISVAPALLPTAPITATAMAATATMPMMLIRSCSVMSFLCLKASACASLSATIF